MHYRSNPPWADTILKAAYPAIQAAAPQSALPIPEERVDQSGRKKKGWREYGTGHYGTVYPTNAIERWVQLSKTPDYYKRSWHHASRLLGDARVAANKIRMLMKKPPIATSAGARRREALIERFTDEFTTATSDLQNEPLGNYVGEAMAGCLISGLLLADVHTNNIGMPTGEVAEEIGETCIITDPGHAVALDDRFAGVTIKDLV